MFFRLGCVGRQAVATKRGRPSLDLSFMVPGTLDPRLTFTRASVGTYFDVTGTMQTATTNTPRWDYNPTTHALNGLLAEEARTNLLLNSATLGTQSVAVTAQAYTLSFYGTGTVTLSGVSTAGPLTGTGAFPQRVSLTFTPTAGTLTCTVTGSVLNAQLEAGASPTSYIPTTGTTATRVVENCTMPLTGGWFNTAQSSLLAEYMVPQSPNLTASNRDVCAISDGTTANRFFLRGIGGGSANAFILTYIATVPATVGIGAVSANVAAKIAGAWNGTTQAGSIGGVAVSSGATGIPAGLTTLSVINNFTAANNLNGWIRRVAYWPRALSNAELQAATT